jgi:hypothetical protein
MSEQTPPDTAEASVSSPGAAAASRARRIGGGAPSPFPRPARPEVEPEQSAGVDLTKPPATDEPEPVAPPATVPAQTEQAPAAPERSGGRGSRWPAIVLGVIAGLLAIAVAVFGIGLLLRSTPNRNATRENVLAAAKTCIAKISYYDYRKMPQVKADAATCVTGNFAGQYNKSIAAITPVVIKTQAVNTFQVANAGIEGVSSDGKQWTVLIFGQTNLSTAAGGSKPNLGVRTARMTMVDVGGKWVVSNLVGF